MRNSLVAGMLSTKALTFSGSPESSRITANSPPSTATRLSAIPAW
jgi:hypothetical protein